MFYKNDARESFKKLIEKNICAWSLFTWVSIKRDPGTGVLLRAFWNTYFAENLCTATTYVTTLNKI